MMHTTYRYRMPQALHLLAILSLIGAALLAGGIGVTYADSPAPFTGNWQATDVDGSDMALSIGGRPTGPFQITWRDDYISFCNGEAGIVRGTGWLNEADSNLLEADVHLECFATGDTLDFFVTWHYHPTTNTLSVKYDSGAVTIWHRPGTAPPPPPALNLRVNYGHDWVESFYEGGHMAWITVTDSDGGTKATAELVTEPKDSMGGETGFQTRVEDWIPAPPDIQPNDWVYGWIDNGASAQVQIGDISGTIDLAADSIGGTILAPWFADQQVEVECHSWGAQLPVEILKYDMIQPDGVDPYACSWLWEWDIQPGQDVGVAYTGPDGQWVANAFFVTNPTFVAYMPSAIEGYDWPMGSSITININDGEYTAQALSEQRPDSPEGATRVLFELWRGDFFMEAGDHIVMTDGTVTKEVVVTNLAVTDINLGAGTVSGLYDPGYDLWVWLYGQDGQVPATDADTGTWVATFAPLPPGAWGAAVQHDTDGDGTSLDFQVPNPNLYALADEDKIVAQEWIAGVPLDLKTYDSSGVIYSDSRMVEPPSEVPWTVVVFDLGASEFDLLPGQQIVLNQRGYVRELVVSSLMITGFDYTTQQVMGTGDPGAQIFVRINGEDVWGVVNDAGNWAISHPQLAPGVWGEAIEPDGIDGDETRDGFQAPFE